jgi:single-strand DNA-binding protein
MGSTSESGQSRQAKNVKKQSFAAKYIRKGRKVYLEGRVQTRTYTGKDGIEKTVTEIVLDDMLFLDSMPKDVQDTVAVKDTVESAPVQQL